MSSTSSENDLGVFICCACNSCFVVDFDQDLQCACAHEFCTECGRIQVVDIPGHASRPMYEEDEIHEDDQVEADVLHVAFGRLTVEGDDHENERESVYEADWNSTANDSSDENYVVHHVDDDNRSERSLYEQDWNSDDNNSINEDHQHSEHSNDQEENEFDDEPYEPEYYEYETSAMCALQQRRAENQARRNGTYVEEVRTEPEEWTGAEMDPDAPVAAQW